MKSIKTKISIWKIALLICLVFVVYIISFLFIDPSLKRGKAEKIIKELNSTQDISKFINGDLIVQKTLDQCGWKDMTDEVLIRPPQYICHPFTTIWVGTNDEEKVIKAFIVKTAKENNWVKIRDYAEYYRKNTNFYFELQIRSASSEAVGPVGSIHYDGLGKPIVEAAKSGKYKHIYQVRYEKDSKWGSLYN